MLNYLIETIEELNSNLYEHLDVLPGTTYRPFCLETDGVNSRVTFFGEPVWASIDADSDSILYRKIKADIISASKEILENIQSMKI